MLSSVGQNSSMFPSQLAGAMLSADIRKCYCKNYHCLCLLRNTGLEEAQAGINIAGRNINNLRYADDTTLMAESEEELKSLLKDNNALDFLSVLFKMWSMNQQRLYHQRVL